MTTNITLITFRNCPNAEKTRQALKDIGVCFRDIVSDDLPPAHPWRKFSSPSLLQGETLIFGSDQDGVGACSLKVPTAEFLKDRLLGKNGKTLIQVSSGEMRDRVMISLEPSRTTY